MQTTNTQATVKAARQSKEAQRNAKITAAYDSLRYEGAVPGSATLESWRVASGSTAGVTYIVSHDLITDYTRCSCPAGIHDRVCVHQIAVKRALDERRARIAAQMAREAEAACGGYNDTLNLMYGTQVSSDY